jgi:DNA-binding transcriptional ArsR family regulator
VTGDANIAAIAALLADPVRVQFLLSLREDQGLPAGELARLGGVSPSTASFHLSKLVAAGLLTVHARGQRHYFRLSNPQLVRAVEALALVAPAGTVTSLRQSRAAAAVRFARICDGHLGGHLGVRLTQTLIERALLIEAGEGYRVGTYGLARLRELQINHTETPGPGHLIPRHPDWSENGHHLAGSLAKALTDRMLELDWITPTRTARAVRLTRTGRAGLRTLSASPSRATPPANRRQRVRLRTLNRTPP